ncbi:MAG: hypothetical protein WAR79_05870 [Melioribacteraceae bacterium]
MSQLNSESSKSKSKCPQCKSKAICDDKLTICLENDKGCNHRYYFGDSVFCANPDIVNFNKKKNKDYPL